jgi:hypothetical protein
MDNTGVVEAGVGDPTFIIIGLLFCNHLNDKVNWPNVLKSKAILSPVLIMNPPGTSVSLRTNELQWWQHLVRLKSRLYLVFILQRSDKL